jgi:hypothetical protein
MRLITSLSLCSVILCALRCSVLKSLPEGLQFSAYLKIWRRRYK